MTLQDLKDAIAAAEKQGYDPRFIPVKIQREHGFLGQSASPGVTESADRAEMVSHAGLAFTIVT